jgi:hypothetical protein
MEYPRLIESNLRGYLQEKLYLCHQTKANLYVWVFNVGIFLAFCIILGLVLYFKRRSMDVPEYVKEEKMLREQNYILSKIRDYQNYEKRKRQESSMITDLPFDLRPQCRVGHGPGVLNSRVSTPQNIIIHLYIPCPFRLVIRQILFKKNVNLFFVMPIPPKHNWKI